MAKSNNLKLTLCASIALAGSVLPVLAGQSVVSKEIQQPLVEEAQKSAITGDIGFNITSQYIDRGMVRENQGVIGQPYFDLYFNLYEGDGFLNRVSFVLGAWSSLHSAKTQQGLAEGRDSSSTPAWYEFDYSAGFAFTVAKNLTITPSYIEFNSPNDAFDTARAFNIRLDYDDSDLLGAFALHPHVTYLRELENKVGTGSSKGNYYEVGLTPALPAFGPVTVTIPLTAGFGSNRFYATNQGFGYFSGGVNAAVALDFIPAAYGTWTLNAGASYYYLNGSLSQANDIQARNNNTFVFNGGLNLAF